MKRYSLLALVFFMGMVLFAQSDELKRWSDQYDRSGSLADKLELLKEAKSSNLTNPGEFFAWALNRLLTQYPSVRGTNDLAVADEAARLIAGVLGDTKQTAAGPNLRRTFEAFSNSLVKAAALEALGRGGMTDQLPFVVQRLVDLNGDPPSDRNVQIENERIAAGAISSLEYYKDVSGYLPVFIASKGWYSVRIRNQARDALPNIAGDPTESLLGMVKSPTYNAETKHTALEAEEASQASTESKSSVAVAALGQGWNAPTNDVHLQNEQAAMRKLAISMIRRYGASDEREVHRALELSYDDGIDVQERLDAIAALSALATDNAAALLASKIDKINMRIQDGGASRVELQLIRALIPALGATKNQGAEIRRTLRAVVDNAQATNPIRDLARRALTDIGR